MRKETDDFVCQADNIDSISAELDGDEICISVYTPIALTKQQARKFAKQILEMTGDADDEANKKLG